MQSRGGPDRTRAPAAALLYNLWDEEERAFADALQRKINVLCAFLGHDECAL